MTTARIATLEAVVIELRQALTEQHNRMASEIIRLYGLLYEANAPQIEAALASTTLARVSQEQTLPPSQRHLENTAEENARLRERCGTHWIESATTLHAPDEDEEYDALGLTLLTDDQALATWERVKAGVNALKVTGC